MRCLRLFRATRLRCSSSESQSASSPPSFEDIAALAFKPPPTVKHLATTSKPSIDKPTWTVDAGSDSKSTKSALSTPAVRPATRRAPRRRETPAVLSVTPAAADRLRELMNEHISENPDGNKPIGVRVGVRRRGCSGHSYTMDLEFDDELHKSREQAATNVVEDQGVRVFVNDDAVMYVVGSVMDFKRTLLSESFEFENPNASGSCGCGESFLVAE